MHHTAPRRRPSKRALLIGGFLLLLIGLVAGNLLRTELPITSSSPNNSRAVALGREVYLANCASCHGANLEGAPNWKTANPDGTMPAPPHDASGHTWHHSDDYLFTTVKEGSAAVAPLGYQASMPGFGGALSDEEIYAVLAYIKSTWPPEVQAAQRRGHD